jgi:hypothetical protein
MIAPSYDPAFALEQSTHTGILFAIRGCAIFCQYAILFRILYAEHFAVMPYDFYRLQQVANQHDSPFLSLFLYVYKKFDINCQRAQKKSTLLVEIYFLEI